MRLPSRAAARLVFFPVLNLSGSAVPLQEIQDSLERALRARGLQITSGRQLEPFLARHRIRYTGGVDAEIARLAQQELDAEGIIVASVDLYATTGVPRHAMTMRLVATGAEPAILWMDGTARAGDDSPGLFGAGMVGDVRELQQEAIGNLTRSLATFLAEGRFPAPCQGAGRFAPRVRYRHPLSAAGAIPSIAVLPFRNESDRRDAGEVATLQFTKQLSASASVRVIEPGVVRSELLRNRVIMEGGVTFEAARVALATMQVDVVLAGTVFAFGDGGVELTVIAIQTSDNKVVWTSSSSGRGSDGVYFFDRGLLSTPNAVACAMSRTLVDGMVEAWGAGRARSGGARPRRSVNRHRGVRPSPRPVRAAVVI